MISVIIFHVGCDSCYKGYQGRIALHEVLLLNQDIRDAIVNNKKKEEIRNLIYDSGNTISLLDDGLVKVINGLTSFEEVLRVIDIEDDLGEEQKKLKDAIIGKEDSPDTNSQNIENLDISDMETLDI